MPRLGVRLRVIAGLALLLPGMLPAQAQDSEAPAAGVWEYGGGPGRAKYSPLTQVNTANVSQLELAWMYDSGATQDSQDYNSRSRLQTTPLVLDGRLYGVSPALDVFALDAATGELLWRHAHDWGGAANSVGGLVLRGLAHWQGRTLFYTAGTYLHALDMQTGQPLAAFGESGRVDLRAGLGRPVDELSVSSGSPGAVFEDLLILGSTVGESLPAAPGDVRAYNVHTGALVWSFHTIPHPGEFGHETWPADAWTYTGGANAWSGISLDEKRGMVFFGTGSAADDFNGSNRHGDNLFANSVVALDARTGKRRWHFQVVKHDVWDRDLPAPPALVTVERDGRSVDALAQVTKSGHVFVLDRDTGESLFPLTEVAAEPSSLPGERLATSQVLPLLPEPLTRQVFTAEDVTTRSPEAAADVRRQLETLTTGGQFLAPSTRGQVVFPGFDGGAEWGGPAFDPELGLLFINTHEIPWLLQMEERFPLGEGASAASAYQQLCSGCHGAGREGLGEFPPLTGLQDRYAQPALEELIGGGRGRMPGFHTQLGGQGVWAMAGWILDGTDRPIAAVQDADSPLFLRYRLTGYFRFLDHEGYPANKPPWGTLTAIDLDSGKQVWRVPLGEHPELVAQGLRATGSMNYGGPVVTAGGLVFIAATSHDNQIRAFNRRSGQELWRHDLPAAGNATPAVYEADGRQFIVISAGGNKFDGPRTGQYLAFALPKETVKAAGADD